MAFCEGDSVSSSFLHVLSVLSRHLCEARYIFPVSAPEMLVFGINLSLPVRLGFPCCQRERKSLLRSRNTRLNIDGALKLNMKNTHTVELGILCKSAENTPISHWPIGTSSHPSMLPFLLLYLYCPIQHFVRGYP